MSFNSSLEANARIEPPSEPAFNIGEPYDRIDLALAAILALCALAMFWKAIFTPSMLFFRDIFNYTYPSTCFIRQMIRHGEWPYWNPYLNYGQPLLENPNLLFFYPYTLFIILLPIKLAYPLYYALHTALAGIGTYLLARRWGQSRPAAFFAGFAFAFSGPLLSLGNLYNHAACAAWMPWALLATDRAVRGRTARPWILLTLIFSLQFLAAEPFTFITTFILCLAYALYLGGTRQPLMSRSNLRIIAVFILVGCLMAALCAIQFLPSAELLSHSRRGAQGLRYGETANWSFNPLLIVEMLVPGFYGPALTSPTSWNALVGDGNSPYFISVFTGFVPLFFALAGWAFGRDRRRNFVAGSALLILVLSFGHFTPIFSLAYLLVPMLALVRFPVKLLVPFIMLVAMLAGWGVDALRRDSAEWKAKRGRALLPLAILLTCCLAVWAAAWIAPGIIVEPVRWMLLHAGRPAKEAGEMVRFLASMLRIYVPGVTGFVLGGGLLLVGLGQDKGWARKGIMLFAFLGMAQLVMVNYDANPTVPEGFFTYRPPALSKLSAPPGTYRVDAQARISSPTADRSDLQGYVSFESIPEVAGLPPVAQGEFQQKLVLGAGSMLNGVEEGLNLDIERSLPPFLYDMWIYVLRQAPDALHLDCLLGRTNVKYIVDRKPRDSSGSRVLAAIFSGSPKPSYLYEDLYFMPRAYVAGAAVSTTSPLETLSRMASPDFDARGTVILAAEPGAAPAVADAGPAGQVEITERRPNQVTLSASLARPGYVVLLDRYDSNWHAELDGKEVPVLRANQLFRAVFAPAGTHTLYFRYHQKGLLAGAIISALTCLLLAGAWFSKPFKPFSAG